MLTTLWFRTAYEISQKRSFHFGSSYSDHESVIAR